MNIVKSWETALLMAAGIFLAGAANAASKPQSPYYVEGELGAGHVNDNCTGLTPCKRQELAYRGLLGVSLADRLSAEFGYMSFGKAYSESGAGLVGARNVSTTARGLMLGVAYRMPLSDMLFADVRGGVARIQMKFRDRIAGTAGEPFVSTTTSMQPYLGAGFGVRMTPNVSASFNADLSRGRVVGRKESQDGKKEALRMIGVSLRANF